MITCAAFGIRPPMTLENASRIRSMALSFVMVLAAVLSGRRCRVAHVHECRGLWFGVSEFRHELDRPDVLLRAVSYRAIDCAKLNGVAAERRTLARQISHEAPLRLGDVFTQK